MTRDWPPAREIRPRTSSMACSGATASAAPRRPWPYLTGALSAPLAYALTLQVLDIPFVS